MQPNDNEIKNARFDTRLSKEQKAYFERAAQLGGYRNMTDFVIAALQEKANEIVTEHERIIASRRDSEIFFDAVFNQKSPDKELSKAAEEFKAFISK